MDEDGLPIVGSGIDLTKVPAIQQRRIVAFLNQFIVHTVRFLNRFSTVCEEKLASISLRIQQIETTLSILEAKLSSIPGLEDVRVEGVGQTVESNGPVVTSSQSQMTAAESPPEEAPGQQKTEASTENSLTVSKDPRYTRYLKMVQVGVPAMAIKNKMILEGLDPTLLDTPTPLCLMPERRMRRTETMKALAANRLSATEPSFALGISSLSVSEILHTGSQ